jgi:hypothetical protein
MKKPDLVKKLDALAIAREMGCSGAHKDKDGNWMPCASMDELERLSNIAETSKWRTVVAGERKAAGRSTGKKKKKRRIDNWENLNEMPIRGIETIDGGGLVSGNFAGKAESSPCWPGYKQVGMKPGKNGSMVPNCVPVSGKALQGPQYVREDDTDVFMDPDSARSRARQIGCIGVSRRVSKNGRTVWMPCTNMTDYANRTGSTSLGRRNAERTRSREIMNAVRTVFRSGGKSNLKKKHAISEELSQK